MMWSLSMLNAKYSNIEIAIPTPAIKTREELRDATAPDAKTERAVNRNTATTPINFL